MKPLTCRNTRRRLQAFHDQELPIRDQIAVATHLDWCDECAELLAQLRIMATTLRAVAPGRVPSWSGDEASSSLQAAILGRMKAERDEAFFPSVRRMFEDLHLVYAALGAAGATAVCLIVMLGMLRFATDGRPDSLAAIVNELAAPRWTTTTPVPLDARLLFLPALEDGAFGTDQSAFEDSFLTLSGVVTREGRIENLELLPTADAPRQASAPDEQKLVEGLLDAASHARVEPARVAGLPVAYNMVWLVARTTVHGNKEFHPEPTARRRAVQHLLTDSLSHTATA